MKRDSREVDKYVMMGIEVMEKLEGVVPHAKDIAKAIKNQNIENKAIQEVIEDKEKARRFIGDTQCYGADLFKSWTLLQKANEDIYDLSLVGKPTCFIKQCIRRGIIREVNNGDSIIVDKEYVDCIRLGKNTNTNNSPVSWKGYTPEVHLSYKGLIELAKLMPKHHKLF